MGPIFKYTIFECSLYLPWLLTEEQFSVWATKGLAATSVKGTTLLQDDFPKWEKFFLIFQMEATPRSTFAETKKKDKPKFQKK